MYVQFPKMASEMLQDAQLRLQSIFFGFFFFLHQKQFLVTFQCFFFLSFFRKFLVTFYCVFFRFFFLHQKNFGHFLLPFFFDFFFLHQKNFGHFLLFFFSKIFARSTSQNQFFESVPNVSEMFFLFFSRLSHEFKSLGNFRLTSHTFEQKWRGLIAYALNSCCIFVY